MLKCKEAPRRFQGPSSASQAKHTRWSIRAGKTIRKSHHIIQIRFKEDNCEGQILKRFLGTSASSNRLTQLYSLSDNNYMYDGTAISRNVWSIKMQTSTETLSDCSKTVQNSLVKLYNETKAEFLADNFRRKSGRQKFLESRAQNTWCIYGKLLDFKFYGSITLSISACNVITITTSRLLCRSICYYILNLCTNYILADYIYIF